jgi:hypothetical protein
LLEHAGFTGTKNGNLLRISLLNIIKIFRTNKMELGFAEALARKRRKKQMKTAHGKKGNAGDIATYLIPTVP